MSEIYVIFCWEKIDRNSSCVISVSVYRAACAASRRIICLHTPGAIGSVCGNRSLELPVPDCSMEVSSGARLWYGFSTEPEISHFRIIGIL